VQNIKIPRRISTAILNSLGVGVVPRVGLEYIAVGRKKEVNAILSDLENVKEGGSAFRFVVGRYGSGKSFLLQLARNNALERDFLVADADLSPERRLTGTKGQGLATYRELMQHLSTKTRPDGNALEVILQKWISSVQQQVLRDGVGAEDARFIEEMESRMTNIISDMQSYLHGFDFAKVLTCYWRGIRLESDDMKQNAMCWLRGEYSTKTEARALGVSQIITDDSWYDFLKLFARLSVKIGYKGLILLIDEGVNLYKITNRVSRENNYEKLLTMFNDIMQGKAEYIGVIVGGTPQFVEDDRRGLYSYEALRSRLQESRMVKPGMVDYSGAIIRLSTLTNEEIYLMLERIMQVFSVHNGVEPPLNEAQMVTFMESVAGRLGADQLLTPREVTRDFIPILNLLLQNPSLSYEQLVASGSAQVHAAEADPDALEDDRFALFDV
jgi:hypothetical protein